MFQLPQGTPGAFGSYLANGLQCVLFAAFQNCQDILFKIDFHFLACTHELIKICYGRANALPSFSMKHVHTCL